MSETREQLAARLEEVEQWIKRSRSTTYGDRGLRLQMEEAQRWLSDYADALREPRLGTWQPIETAPKDGTRVLTYCATTSFSNQRFDLMHFAWHWRSHCMGLANQPTHWMPLPPAPREVYPNDTCCGC